MSWRHDLAWAAGFFDGEGCISTGTIRGRWRYIRTDIGQIERTTLDRFRDAVGLGKIDEGEPRGHLGPKRSRLYRWRVHGLERTQAVVAMLWPYLSAPKREQYTRKLAWLREGRW